MTGRSNRKRARSQVGKPRIDSRDQGVRVISPEEMKRLVQEGYALTNAPPAKFNKKKAMQFQMKMDSVLSPIADRQSDKEYFEWLEAEVPEMFKAKGRPRWIECVDQDRALLKNFDEKLNRNIAAGAKRKYGASKKTYGDLADEFGDQDVETVKRRVMRARARQKTLQEVTKDILSIAAAAEKGRNKAVTPREYKRLREKLVKAFRSVLKSK